MRIALVVPIYHSNELHTDFTKQTLNSISTLEHQLQVYIIVNYSLPELRPTWVENISPNFVLLDNPKGNHVGASWNFGIKKAFEDKCEYILVINNDIIFHLKAIDNLVKFAQEHPEFILWTASEWSSLRTIKQVKDEELGVSFDEHPHFSCFMINKRTIDTVGWFDENLKVGYFEDGDLHYRIILSGNKAGKTLSSRFYHYGSRTIKVDERLDALNKKSYEGNRVYIRKKWNMDFHEKAYHPPEEILKEKDIYKHPFNDKTKDWRYW